MVIQSNHWLTDAKREPLAGGSAMNVRRCVVIHFTAGASAMSSINFWRTPAAKGASAHIVIDRDGTVYQCRPFNRTCGHAGRSKWTDPNTGKKYTGCNAFSVGIELANGGSTYPTKFSKLDPIRARHRNGGPMSDWERFPQAQIAACESVTKLLVDRYNLDDITGHDCIAPSRKDDPGPAFPMRELREACGFSGLPEVHWG